MTEVHVPINRGGGMFNEAKNVKLHANDFNVEDKLNSLPEADREAVSDYVSRSLGVLRGKLEVTASSRTHIEKAWEEHYQKSAHHFPLKNYVIHAFPSLKDSIYGERNAMILECGCGTGSTLIPLMRECKNELCTFAGFDISVSALERFSKDEVAVRMKESKRLSVFLFPEETDPITPLQKARKIEGGSDPQLHHAESFSLAAALSRANVTTKADHVLLVFVLSALASIDDMRRLLLELKSTLKPDGQILFRDHALPDHNFFRFRAKLPPGSETPLFFVKGDGTTQFFFDSTFTLELFDSVGMRVDTRTQDTVHFHCNHIENRKNGKSMDKVFLNCTFTPKPPELPS